MWAPIRGPPAPLPIQLPGDSSGKAAEDGPHVWDPATQAGGREDTLGSWLQVSKRQK